MWLHELQLLLNRKLNKNELQLQIKMPIRL